ncbi:MAG: hypothetical protein KDC04_07125 [Saprospiraceae bacterium]|nr:hypothetical protein [Saprospiraceae bacterium]MCB9311086.1 hypothetical protein [Lewinellaceae bacterium]
MKFLPTLIGTASGLCILLHSCVVPPDYSITPTLEFVSYSKDTMDQGSILNDSTFLTLYFTDGDGDFGEDIKTNATNITLKDLRTGEVFRNYKAPIIPETGTSNGIAGTIKIKVYTTCCIFPIDTGLIPCESDPDYSNTLTFEIFITDRAGHVSNTLVTPPLTLKCQ